MVTNRVGTAWKETSLDCLKLYMFTPLAPTLDELSAIDSGDLLPAVSCAAERYACSIAGIKDKDLPKHLGSCQPPVFHYSSVAKSRPREASSSDLLCSLLVSGCVSSFLCRPVGANRLPTFLSTLLFCSRPSNIRSNICLYLSIRP